MQPRRLALAYDLMEPARPKVDWVLLEFLRSQALTPSDFVVTTGGVCRLHPQLARLITRLVASETSVTDHVAAWVGH